MGGVGRAVREPARHRHRQHDRQRRAAHARARPRGRRRRPPVGRRPPNPPVCRAAAPPSARGLGSLLLLAGALGDRFGRRRTLLAGLGVFGGASACAAYAGGVEGLIVARAVMGAGAAFIMPATLSLLISVFTDARERRLAIGIWAATAGGGVALGP